MGMKEEARKKERLIFSEAQDPEDAEPGECQVEGTIEEFWGIKTFVAFCSFFHVASLFSTTVNNKKVGVDNEKALELTNSTVFHRGRQ